jgi:hypothetical protein
LKRNVPTTFIDPVDLPKFSQLVEVVKDTFVEEFRAFFARPTTAAARFAEILNIEKYAIAPQSTDPFETLLTMIREYPDILQKLPLISVTKSSGSKRPIAISGAFVDHVQYPPRVRTTLPQPYNLSAILNVASAPTIVFETRPDGRTDRTSTMRFPTTFFPTPTAVTAQQLVDAINFQALYAKARAVVVGANTFLELVAGGPIRVVPDDGRRTIISDAAVPNRITITGGTATLLAALGLTVGQADTSDNPLRPPTNRYATSANFTIGIDIGATSDNERTEITDLLIYFLNLYMNDRDYTFYGQHVFEEAGPGATTERFFQIILGDWTMTGEADIARPDGEREDKIYVNRFNIPVTAFDYVDRIIPSNLIPPIFSIRQKTFQANGQPTNITGVVIISISDTTLSGTGVLTYVAGATRTLQWQAPGAVVPGAAVVVGLGGTFTLPGGDGSSIAVTVSATGLPLNSATQPVNTTGVSITLVSTNTLAGVGTLTYVVAGLLRTLQWDPPGGEGAGAVVDVSAGGSFTLFGGGPTASITVTVNTLLLPTTSQVDLITVTTTYSDSIALNREELPGAS